MKKLVAIVAAGIAIHYLLTEKNLPLVRRLKHLLMDTREVYQSYLTTIFRKIETKASRIDHVLMDESASSKD